MFETGGRARDASVSSVIFVRAGPRDARRGIFCTDGAQIPCALGRGGITRGKREGDGATPAGRLALVRGWYRADRLPRPATALPLAALHPWDGWCDAAADRNYNRHVALPYPASHERLWRDDGLYDVVIELDWNRTPRVQGRGSAIFLHIARPGYAPTEGCIALAQGDLLRLLPRLRAGTMVVVG
jgi:L,D-peptidoglycan transpeptidase YkuD (ErfK/YbiS/YcfS/YnhG family)